MDQSVSSLTLTHAAVLFQALANNQSIDIRQFSKTLNTSPLVLQKALNWLTSAGLKLEHAGPERWRSALTIEPLYDLDQLWLDKTHQIHYVFSTESTNKDVQNNQTLIADYQTSGQGRNGKNWVNPPGYSIAFSYARSINQSIEKLSGLSIVAAAAIIDTLGKYLPTPDHQIKWPNDIYTDGKKAGGILIQAEPDVNDTFKITIGIGLNWSIPDEILQQIEQPCTNLISEQPHRETLSRSGFLKSLLFTLHHHVGLFEKQGLDRFIETFRSHDYLNGLQICAHMGKELISGSYQGITDNGLLKLKHDGKLITLTSGEVSVRPV